jgi:hypothetical protein
MKRSWCAKVCYPDKPLFLFGTLVRPIEDKEETVREYMYREIAEHLPDGFIICAMLPGFALVVEEREDQDANDD